MSENIDARALDEAVRHAEAGLKALRAARDGLQESGTVYPIHIQLAAAELASAVESSMRVALRNS